MKTAKSVLAVAACAVLAACLMCAFSPTAYAANSVSITTSAEKAQSTAPKPKPVTKVKATFEDGTVYFEDYSYSSDDKSLPVIVSWKAPKMVKGLKKQTYSIRYAESLGDPCGHKIKTTAKTSFRLPASQEGSTVQIRVNAKYGKKTVHSKWVTYYINGGGYSSRATYSNGRWVYFFKYSITIENQDGKKPGSWEDGEQAAMPRSVKLTSTSPGEVRVTWKEPKKVPETSGSHLYPDPKYAIWYSYSKNMKNAKSKFEIEGESITLKNLKKGKKLYVRVCTEGYVAGETSYYWTPISRSTSAKAITVAKKPKLSAVSAVKLTSPKGKATISWKASKVKGVKNQAYTVRYAYNKSMKNAKTKTVKAKKATLSALKPGKKLYVQVRTNAEYGKETLHSKWSAKTAKTWIEEQGHYEPVYTTVVDQEAYTTTTRIYYTQDGWSSTDREAVRAHHLEVGGHTWWEDVTEEHPAVTHQEEAGQKWVADVPAHWE